MHPIISWGRNEAARPLNERRAVLFWRSGKRQRNREPPCPGGKLGALNEPDGYRSDYSPCELRSINLVGGAERACLGDIPYCVLNARLKAASES